MNQRKPGEVVEKDCCTLQLNKENAVNCSDWRILIKDIVEYSQTYEVSE